MGISGGAKNERQSEDSAIVSLDDPGENLTFPKIVSRGFGHVASFFKFRIPAGGAL